MKMRFVIIGLAILGLAFVLNIISVAIPYWFYNSVSSDEGSSTVYIGLWKYCYDSSHGNESTSRCHSFDQLEETLPTELYVPRILEILAILVTAAAIAVVCLKMFYMKKNTRLLYIATPIPLLAGLLMIIGAVVFVVHNKTKEEIRTFSKYLHAGFGLSIVSGILSLMASPIIFLAARAFSVKS